MSQAYSIEALVEVPGGFTEADTLARKLRETQGLNANITRQKKGSNGNGNGHRPYVTLWVTGQADTYQKAEGAIRKIRSAVGKTKTDSTPIVAVAGVYDSKGNGVYKNGHSK